MPEREAKRDGMKERGRESETELSRAMSDWNSLRTNDCKLGETMADLIMIEHSAAGEQEGKWELMW